MCFHKLLGIPILLYSAAESYKFQPSVWATPTSTVDDGRYLNAYRSVYFSERGWDGDRRKAGRRVCVCVGEGYYICIHSCVHNMFYIFRDLIIGRWVIWKENWVHINWVCINILLPSTYYNSKQCMCAHRACMCVYVDLAEQAVW